MVGDNKMDNKIIDKNIVNLVAYAYRTGLIEKEDAQDIINDYYEKVDIRYGWGQSLHHIYIFISKHSLEAWCTKEEINN